MESQSAVSRAADQPLVSCIMPTFGRPKLVPESVAMFLWQDYPNKELIILNDCPGQEYTGNLPNIRIINLDSRYSTLGDKRNAAVDYANGSLIAIWDDDDVYLPWRLSYSVGRMLQLQTPFFLAGEFWAYWGAEQLESNHATPQWISHPLVMFSKELWKNAGGYPSITLGEDSVFFEKVFHHLGMEWNCHAVERTNRFMILRGVSHYQHTSIDGGKEPPDASTGVFEIEPRPIADGVLRNAVDRLILMHHAVPRIYQDLTSMFAEPHGHIGDTTQHALFLDDLVPLRARVGYGQLGLHGDLGYENKRVVVSGQQVAQALSSHGPAELRFQLDGHFDTFFSRVAINDDVHPGASAADFMVFANGCLVGIAQDVHAGDLERSITADIRGVNELQLVVQPRRFDFCHSVWVAPRVCRLPGAGRVLVDALQRNEIAIPDLLPKVDVCLATVGSPEFLEWVDDLLASIRANARCDDALLALFFFDICEEAVRIANKHNAVLIPCRSRVGCNEAVKSVLYSAGRIIPAEKFICLDADMLVLDDLRPILAAIDCQSPGAVLTCRETLPIRNLGEALRVIYNGATEDTALLLNGCHRDEAQYPLVVNDGFFSASRSSLCAIDELIRWMPEASAWMDRDLSIGWRNQFVFNLALARLRCGAELDERFNIQLNYQNLELDENGPAPLHWNGRRAAVVHFNGRGRHKHPEFRELCRRTHAERLAI